MTWRELAKSNRSAAFELLETRRYRSCVSRAYYAVYSETTHALVEGGVQMPSARNNPRHKAVPSLVGYQLLILSPKLRWKLEYNPVLTVDESEARAAMRFTVHIVKLLEAIP
jgi:hypothetical protein